MNLLLAAIDSLLWLEFLPSEVEDTILWLLQLAESASPCPPLNISMVAVCTCLGSIKSWPAILDMVFFLVDLYVLRT